MDFVAVVNSMNRKPLLKMALESLVDAVRKDPLDYAIVVFDAGSTDGSREWLETFAQTNSDVRLEVIKATAGEDTSFAAGVNRGCEQALSLFPDLEFIFLYETDNWVSSAKPIGLAMELLRGEADLAAMGFTVRLHSGDAGGWGMSFPTVTSFVLGREISRRLALPRFIAQGHITAGAEWFTADVVYTSPLLIKREAWKILGGIDAQHFPFSDCDLDWAWRASRKGYKLGVLKTDAVVHDGRSQSSGWSSMRVLGFHQARFQLLRTYRGRGVVLAIPALFLRHVMEYGLLFGLFLARRRPFLSLKKRFILLRRVWSGYRTV